MDIIDVIRFATKAHGDQKRKYTGEPYIVHPVEVAEWVRRADGDPWMIASAYLHDVVEDTPVSCIDIQRHFGVHIVNLVWCVTNISRPEDGNRAARKAIDRAHISKAPPSAKTIKLADMISNTSSIMQYDLAFARVYIPEKRLLLGVLEEGHPLLHAHATKLVEQAEKELGLC